MRFQALIPTVAGLGLTACAQYENWRDPEVAACESYLKETLKAPSSYKRISFSKIDTPVDKRVLADAVGIGGEIGNSLANMADAPGIRGILLEYDAQNSFGTALRDKTVCYFAMDDVRSDKFALSPEQQASRASSRLLAAKADELETGQPQEAGLCCLSDKFDLTRLHAAMAAESKRSAASGETAMDAQTADSEAAE